ncbi:hypothetical protein V1511DRAFT_494135 [Dipodascopsis uninucleata]
MAEEESTRSKRLYIGPLSKGVVESPKDLVERIQNFGKPTSALSIHKKEVLDTFFGFITVELTDKQYLALRRALNGVKYKGSVIRVEEARHRSFEERMAEERQSRENEPPESAPTRPQRVQDLATSLTHVRTIHYADGKLIKGRLRMSNRAMSRQNSPTFRIKFNGKIRIYRCKRSKLWGIERTTDPQSQVWKFVCEGQSDGKWINGRGDVLEEVDLSKPHRSDISDESLDFIKKYNLAIDDNGEVSREVIFSDVEEDEVFVAESIEETSDNDGKDQNLTENLRQLFTADDGSSFKLFDNSEDEGTVEGIVDESYTYNAEVNKESASIEGTTTTAEPTAPPIPTRLVRDTALLFLHSDSPFLSAQSQFVKSDKLPKFSTAEDWRVEFYEQRSTWRRQAMRRRHDVVRRARKKEALSGNTISNIKTNVQ